ncbi:UNVERIFIED_CONTAM: hypothetical protein GTU68_027082, partial [Idotea baltica]|nr:hypothetical protein [Idotea baltica]
MAGFSSIFQSNASKAKVLLAWRPCDDTDQWATRAVETLLKKLKFKAVEDLKFVLANPDKPSKCITIPRSSDGRIQVLNKKDLPHVIYCKVWRWPNLQSYTELKAIESCKFPFLKKEAEVCINPYHYVRIEKPSLPPILVPSNSYDNMQGHLPNNFSSNSIESQNRFSSSQYQPPNPNIEYGQTPPNTPPPLFTDVMNHDSAMPMQSSQAVNTGCSSNFTKVQYPEPSHWTNISYYELNDRI